MEHFNRCACIIKYMIRYLSTGSSVYRENTVSWRYFNCIRHKDLISNIQFYTHTWWAEKRPFHHTFFATQTSQFHPSFSFMNVQHRTYTQHKTSQQEPEDHVSQVGISRCGVMLSPLSGLSLHPSVTELSVLVPMSIKGMSVRHAVYSVMNGRGGGSNRNLQIHSSKHLQGAI